MGQKKSQTKKRVDFLNLILSTMRKHEIFSEILNKKDDSESHMQKSLFLRLNKELPKLISSSFGYNEKKSKEIVNLNFKFEKKASTTIKNYPFFGTNHRPDATLELKDIRLAVEIKKGNSGNALRSGIGQAIVYHTEFDFVLYFFVDITPGENIINASKAPKESELLDSLWKNYNIKFMVV